MKEFPIEPFTIVFVRNTDSTWYPDIFKGINYNSEGYPFETYHGFYEMMTPYASDKSCIGTKDDVSELWDAERIKEEGII